MEGYRGKPRRCDVRREIWKVQDRSRRKDREEGQAGDKEQGGLGEALKDTRGIKRRDGNENLFARPNGLREIAETATSCRGPGPDIKKGERDTPVPGRRK